MCEGCRKKQAELVAQIHAAMDEQEVPEDSILRGLAVVQVACEVNPVLLGLMTGCWPSRQALLQ